MTIRPTQPEEQKMPAKKKTVTLEQVFEKLTDYDNQFVKIFDKLTDHDDQFVKIFDKLTDHDDQFVKIDKQLSNLSNKILDVEDSLTKKIELEIEGLGKRLDNLFRNLDKLTKDFEDLSQEYHFITAALARIEKTLGTPEQWPVSVRSEIDAVKDRLTDVEKRIFAVESKGL
jgi:archaellum component FlaC